MICLITPVLITQFTLISTPAALLRLRQIIADKRGDPLIPASTDGLIHHENYEYQERDHRCQMKAWIELLIFCTP